MEVMSDIPKEPVQPLTYLLKLGFLTGSRVIGGCKYGSDYDIVISIIDKGTAINIVKPYAYFEEPSNYFHGTKYHILKNKLINLIFVHPHEFVAWYYTTSALADMFGKDHVDIPKQSRITIFQTLMIQFRDKIPMQKANERESLNRDIAKAAYEKWGARFTEKFNDSHPVGIQEVDF